MKKILFILSITAIAIPAFFAFSMKSTIDYDDLIAEIIKDEFVSPALSNELEANLASVFSHLFDSIEKVDIHHSNDFGYYYTVYGQKDDSPLVHAINVTEEMAKKQFFPSLEQLGKADQQNLAAATCYWQPTLCGTTLTRFRVCGFTVWGVCIPFDIINV